MNPKEPLQDAHKINFATFTKKVAKYFFNCGIFGEVDKVVDVQSKSEGML
jgi:hypothetical protein